MGIVVKPIGAADIGLFADVADVCDAPVDLDRLAAYRQAPGHIMVLAFDGKAWR